MNSKDGDEEATDSYYEPAQLSVLADSAEVEIYLIDKSNMHLYPEDVQKLLNERLFAAFSSERPFDKVIVDNIKDKFREWDKYRIKSYISRLQD